MKMKSLFVSLLTLMVMLCLPSLLMAQGLPGDPGQDPDASVPFDGGLSLLIAAGIGYAAKKGYDKRKQEKASENANL